MTPLHSAAWNNSKDVAELLIINGADVHAEIHVSTALIPISDRIPISLSYED